MKYGLEVSYNACGVFSHMLSDGADVWTVASPSREDILEAMSQAINKWPIDATRNINYRLCNCSNLKTLFIRWYSMVHVVLDHSDRFSIYWKIFLTFSLACHSSARWFSSNSGSLGPKDSSRFSKILAWRWATSVSTIVRLLLCGPQTVVRLVVFLRPTSVTSYARKLATCWRFCKCGWRLLQLTLSTSKCCSNFVCDWCWQTRRAVGRSSDWHLWLPRQRWSMSTYNHYNPALQHFFEEQNSINFQPTSGSSAKLIVTVNQVWCISASFFMKPL